jgi:hypothetical protein
VAALEYATLGGVKRRLDITDSTDDAVLSDIIADVNLDVEDLAYRQIGPSTVTNELLDGFDALEGGRCLLYPKGIRTITTLEIATATGEDFATVPSTDVFIEPAPYLRQPDWPGFEIWMTDTPTSTNTSSTVFLPGFRNIRLTGEIGWAAIPSTVTSAAETTATRTFLSNRGGDSEGSDELGVRNFRALWRWQDLRTVNRYSLKSVEIV